MLPTIIPDSMLAGSNVDKWTQMVSNSFKKVRGTCEIYCPLKNSQWGLRFYSSEKYVDKKFLHIMWNELKIFDRIKIKF